MKLDLTKDAASFLDQLPAKQFKQVANKVLHLTRDPNPNDAKHIHGRPGYRRVDAGEYRIVFTVEGDTVKVPVIGKRNDDEVYRILDRKKL